MTNSIKRKLGIIASFFLAILTVIMSVVFGATGAASATEVAEAAYDRAYTAVENIDDADWWVEGWFERADVIPGCAKALPKSYDEGVTFEAGKTYCIYFTCLPDGEDVCVCAEFDGDEGFMLAAGYNYTSINYILVQTRDFDIAGDMPASEFGHHTYPANGFTARVLFTYDVDKTNVYAEMGDAYYATVDEVLAWEAEQPEETPDENPDDGENAADVTVKENWFSNFLNDASAWISEGTGVAISASAVFVVGVIIIVICLSRRKR
ncbi:MAG: hypothetical protein IKT42_04600 [Clostridia bacterium]|nr:hypothetical protein [Clostridia bacterium]